ncbi:dipeptidase D [Balneicella halophila]|uniref:Cytosol non-specific dipeptidase n=1 Tax=Balneicella halophila TaxID=1537566 RepID=A0A7L4UMX3_BALHA|nr:aminoacyl-histidine dipeptidase [Balneicella halophila]PVX49966.1 dipeptidase D [Balneicella halophila]
MNNEISKLDPKVVWEHFYSLTQVPRPSKHEDRIQKFMYDFGKDLGLETIKDEIGNIIIKKPATSGMEDRQGVILQAHLDMVPQKNAGVDHDFEKDPIETYIEDGWVHAKDTTLGADNGIGAAAMMAVLSSDDLEHGPIECLFTCDEETGMTGAENLKPGVLDGDILMNLDSEDEGELYVGCAGGVDVEVEVPYTLEDCPDNMQGFEFHIKGLKGGHSGMDIHLGKANANKLLARFLDKYDNLGIRLSEAEGGSLRNAIPRESHALLAVPNDKVADFEKAVKEYEKDMQQEFKDIEPTLNVEAKEVGTPKQVIDAKEANAMVKALVACPDGVEAMSKEMEGLTETSNNLARIEFLKGKLLVQCLTRSSNDDAKMALTEKIRDAFKGLDASFSTFGAYPGWQPNMDSTILKAMQEVYKDTFGKTPEIKAVHAGLECGLLGAVYPNWDMISFGPTIRNPHSPDERVNIETVEKFWTFLKASLKAIPAK